MSEPHTHPRDEPTTPGRLTAIHGSYLVIDGTGERIGRCGDHGPHVANARRLAACWNACEGLSTEVLERGPLSEAFEREQDRADSAGRQRDELLEALESALEGMRVANQDLAGSGASLNEEIAEAEAAIAKVKGGAA